MVGRDRGVLGRGRHRGRRDLEGVEAPDGAAAEAEAGCCVAGSSAPIPDPPESGLPASIPSPGGSRGRRSRASNGPDRLAQPQMTAARLGAAAGPVSEQRADISRDRNAQAPASYPHSRDRHHRYWIFRRRPITSISCVWITSGHSQNLPQRVPRNAVSPNSFRWRAVPGSGRTASRTSRAISCVNPARIVLARVEMAGLGSLPNFVAARAAVPGLEARPFGTRPFLPGARNRRWSSFRPDCQRIRPRSAKPGPGGHIGRQVQFRRSHGLQAS